MLSAVWLRQHTYSRLGLHMYAVMLSYHQLHEVWQSLINEAGSHVQSKSCTMMPLPL